MDQKYAERNIALAEALESGEYKQTALKLRDADGFCCLGVACDLYKKATHKGKWLKNFSFSLKNHVNDGIPPGDVATWYGWDACNPTLVLAKNEIGASFANDDAKKTFKQIAKGFRLLAKDLAKKAA